MTSTLCFNEYLARELSNAQMIATSPPGLWSQSIVDLSRHLLRQWAGWNVTSLPTAWAQLPSRLSGEVKAAAPTSTGSSLPSRCAAGAFSQNLEGL